MQNRARRGDLTALPAPRLHGAWASYDKNGDGVLQPAELAQLVALVRRSFTPMQLDAAHTAMTAAGLDVDEQWLRGAWCVARCSVCRQWVVGARQLMNDKKRQACPHRKIRCYFRALRRGVGARHRELLNVARVGMRLDVTIDCEGFERLVQLARRREEAPALLQP